MVWSAVAAGIGRQDLVNPGGWTQVGGFASAALRPELSGSFLRITWDAALTTLSYAVLATLLSVVLGLVLGVLSSETWWGRVERAGTGNRGRRRRSAGWLLVRALLSLPRGVHEVVWGLFLITFLGSDPLVGILAIGIPYGVMTAKVFSELIDEASPRAYRAAFGAGASRLPAMLYTLLPQARGDMVSYAFYRFECSLRAAAILGIIGAGGLGFQLALSFQSLRYGEMWTLIYALVVLCGVADAWSRSLRHPGSVARFRRPGLSGSVIEEAGSLATRRRQARGSLFLGGAMAVLAFWHLGLDVASLWSEKARRLFVDVVGSAWPPDLDTSTLADLARLSLETVEMSVLATALASVGGMAVALLVARSQRPGSAAPAVSWWGRPLVSGVRGLLLLCRAIPPPVGALLLLFVLFPGPLPGALALAVYNFGILGRLMAEVVENLDPGPARSLRSQGASGAQTALYAVLPVALPRFVAFSLYRWEVTLRETVVVGLVGAGGLGRLLSAQLTSFDYAGMASTLAALVVLTFVGDLIGSAVRRSLR